MSAIVFLAVLDLAAFDQPLLVEATIAQADIRGRRVAAATHSSAAAETALLLVRAGANAFLAALERREQNTAMYSWPARLGDWAEAEAGGAIDERAVRAWHVPRAAQLLDHWPLEATIFASDVEVGPGMQSIWLTVDSACVSPGDCFWLRTAGQPVARLETLLVRDDLSFCRVVPLVSDLRVTPIARAALWPGPGDRRNGSVRSAVCHIERQEGSLRLWIAAPRGTACPPEPRIDVLRDGRFIAHARVERRDDRFWYARTLPPLTQAEPRVGDSVQVRSIADIAERRFVARVFETRGEGLLVNAGEIDGITAGQAGTLDQRGETTPVIVTKVQREYCICLPSGAAPAVQPLPGAEVCFGIPAARPVRIATTTITDGRAFSARIDGGFAFTPTRPLLLRSAGQPAVGVAVVVDGMLVGCALPESMGEPLRAPVEVLQTPDSRPGFRPATSQTSESLVSPGVRP